LRRTALNEVELDPVASDGVGKRELKVAAPFWHECMAASGQPGRAAAALVADVAVGGGTASMARLVFIVFPLLDPQVWVTARLGPNGRVIISGDSDSELSRGLVAVLAEALAGLTPEALAAVDPATLRPLGLGPGVLTPSRTNGFLNMLETLRKRARALTRNLTRFPSLVVTADATLPQVRWQVPNTATPPPPPAHRTASPPQYVR
jgi:Fe-S metabolism associated domain